MKSIGNYDKKLSDARSSNIDVQANGLFFLSASVDDRGGSAENLEILRDVIPVVVNALKSHERYTYSHALELIWHLCIGDHDRADQPDYIVATDHFIRADILPGIFSELKCRDECKVAFIVKFLERCIHTKLITVQRIIDEEAIPYLVEIFKRAQDPTVDTRSPEINNPSFSERKNVRVWYQESRIAQAPTTVGSLLCVIAADPHGHKALIAAGIVPVLIDFFKVAIPSAAGEEAGIVIATERVGELISALVKDHPRLQMEIPQAIGYTNMLAWYRGSWVVESNLFLLVNSLIKNNSINEHGFMKAGLLPLLISHYLSYDYSHLSYAQRPCSGKIHSTKKICIEIMIPLMFQNLNNRQLLIPADNQRTLLSLLQEAASTPFDHKYTAALTAIVTLCRAPILHTSLLDHSIISILRTLHQLPHVCRMPNPRAPLQLARYRFFTELGLAMLICTNNGDQRLSGITFNVTEIVSQIPWCIELEKENSSFNVLLVYIMMALEYAVDNRLYPATANTPLMQAHLQFLMGSSNPYIQDKALRVMYHLNPLMADVYATIKRRRESDVAKTTLAKVKATCCSTNKAILWAVGTTAVAAVAVAWRYLPQLLDSDDNSFAP